MTPKSARSSAQRDAVIVAVLSLLALLLRVARLDFQPLWWDEGYSVWFAHQPLAEMLRLTALDIHPPLYYALLGSWSQLFGLAPATLRLLSVIFGVLAVPVAYSVGKWLGGRRAGLVAALLLAINPFHVYYSQEIRMYGLMVLWSLLAIGFAARALGIGGGGGWRVDPGSPVLRIGEGGKWLVGYCVVMVLALYTQYYAAFLAIGLTVAGLVELWRQRRARQAAVWLGAQAVVALLFVPWVLYAGPKLVSYVSQKIVADSDKPLGLVEYLARHLSAYTAGHLEGPLTPWWPLGLVGAAALGWGIWRIARRDARSNLQSHTQAGGADPSGQIAFFQVIRFLLIALAIVLLLGWLVNLTFPFFPDRGERLLLLGLPLFILLVATTIAALLEAASTHSEPSTLHPPPSTLHPPPSTLHSPPSTLAYPQNRRARVHPPLLLALFLALAALSLAAFYTVPRYPDEDYRPLIGQVEQWARPEDTVLAVYPWQVGYFWSYGSPSGPQPLLSPTDDWTPEVKSALDAALARGHLWFPEHLSLGGILEAKVEEALGRNQALLANRWYSPSTRLTGWASAPGADSNPQATAQLAGPFKFFDHVLSDVVYRPNTVQAANQDIVLDLNWAESNDTERFLSLRLIGPDGRAWAHQDFTLAAPASVDRVGLLVPSGTPPGAYTLNLSMLDSAGGRPQRVEGPGLAPDATSLDLGQVDVDAPQAALSGHTLPIEQPLDATLDDALRLIGSSVTQGRLQPGEDLAVSLFWQALPGLASAAPGDLFTVIQLLDDDGQVAAAWEGPPVAWHAASAWQSGELVRSQQAIRLPATLPNGSYRLVTGVFDPVSGKRLTARWGSGPWELVKHSQDTVPLGTVDVAGREHVMTAPQPQVPLQAELARVGRLLGYDLPAKEVTPGGALDLTLYWQAKESTGDRLSVFVHLLDAQGSIIGQSDGEPGNGAFPTSGWVSGETLADHRTVTVRADAPAGPATLVVGFYDPSTNQRVPWLDATGQPRTDSLLLPDSIDVRGQ